MLIVKAGNNNHFFCYSAEFLGIAGGGDGRLIIVVRCFFEGGYGIMAYLGMCLVVLRRSGLSLLGYLAVDGCLRFWECEKEG